MTARTSTGGSSPGRGGSRRRRTGTPARTRHRPGRRPLRPAAILAALAVGAALVLTGTAAPAAGAAARVDNPYAGATPYVNPQWSAKAAADGGAAIADQPTFVWMDRRAAIGGVGEAWGLKRHLDEALAQDADLFQVVIYNLPGRDCAALASNGELKPEELDVYKSQYIDPIADILADPKYASLRIVTLIEPDSLPNMVTNAGGTAGSTDACVRMKELGNYEKGVGYALDTLAAIPHVYTYVDAAHHGWLGWDSNLAPAVDEFKNAATSEGATVDDVHGFIVNTANYSALKEPHFEVGGNVGGTPVRQAKWIDWNQYVDELTYAQALRDLLVSRGGFDPGLGMLVDTSRNGWGGAARPTGPGPTTSVDAFVDGGRVDRRIHAGNWCNQSGAGLGERPVAAPEPGIDAYVWAKPPGESDGSSEPIDNDEGKGFDRMCDPTYEGNPRNGNNPPGALPDSPLAGHWFPAQFRELVANAHPPVGGSGPGDDTEAPTVPAGLAVTGTTGASVSLSWTASSDDVGVTAYDVFRDGTQVGSTAGTAFTDGGLTAATSYAYAVRARDAAGNASARTAPVTATTGDGGGGGGPVKVQYVNTDTAMSDNQIRMGLRLVNTGGTPVDLATVEARYWFSGDTGATSFATWCDWAAAGCGAVTHGVRASGSAAPGADRYLAVGFASGTLAPGASTGEIQVRLAKSDWSGFDESDDYSRATHTAWADNPRVGVYTSGALTWGTAP
ncbi:glycoside hydrolase family 6 protein [Streptomyces sp. WMMC500]|uniref:glycoside hydrolase family 6 protein n=1 Tax=Streptomyces sp. WMMC500 TaxID=3015154 RepID=UPI00248C59ED|nr:glycoside hydrolase family 6 protein [Streptomyces sp. WMMC500]WBB64141.1 glycoside hydrolase family 6 protein [Streptomyces sp. WMMC500]